MSVAIAEEIVDANAEFIAFVEGCSDDEWRAICRAEKWRGGAVAPHPGGGHERAAPVINAIRRGGTLPRRPQAHHPSHSIKAPQVGRVSREGGVLFSPPK